MSLRRVAVTALVPLLLCAGACSTSNGGGEGVQVVTTVSPITNIVQNVGGDRVSVTGIVPEGTNSHTFEPAPSDAAVMEDAEIVFINGLHLEEPTLELAENNAREGVPIVQLADRTISEDEYIYDFSFPESGASRTRICGRTPSTRRSTRRSCGTSSRRSIPRAPTRTGTTTRRSRRGWTRSTRPSATRPPRCPRRTASCSRTTTRSRTSPASTVGTWSGRSSHRTSRSRPRGKSRD